MKRSKIILATTALVLAITGVFATKSIYKKHPGTSYWYKDGSGVCQTSTPVTCTTFNNAQGSCATVPLYTDNACNNLATVSLYLPIQGK